MKNEKFEEYTEKLKEIFTLMNPEEPEDEEEEIYDDDEFVDVPADVEGDEDDEDDE